jgi:iduronate 2-sulfatase
LKPWQDPANMTPARKESVGFGGYGTAFAKLTDQDWRELFRAYCAGTTFMDAQLGRVLDVLDQKQLWDKTIVIFVGDHGYHTGERSWWNKNTLFERACRAPFIIAAPGMKGGQASRSLVEFVDLYPTVTDLCGLKMPHAGAGLSLRPVLENPMASVKDTAFTLLTRSPKLFAQSIRTARWRFNQWSDGHRELYDLDADPEELQDVSASQPDTVQDLAAKLKALPAFQQ